MANDIENLPNSFIQFCEARLPETCNDYSDVKLPIYNAGDLQFMFRMNETDTAYLDSLAFCLIKGSYDEGDTVAETDIINGLNLDYAVIEGSDYVVFSVDETCSPSPLNEGTEHEPEEDECVTLVLVINESKLIICKCLQKFYFTSDLCWTQVIRYNCTDNSYGFFYEEANTELDSQFFNQIRLPITLHSPKPITQKTGFVLSDGEYLTLAAKKEKLWSVQTDHFTDHLHQCLDAAIDHDRLFIFEDLISECAYDDNEFFHPEDDKYEVEWQEKPGQHLGVAQGTFKLKPSPYYSQNSNC